MAGPVLPPHHDAAAVPTPAVVRRFLDASALISRLPPWAVSPVEFYTAGEWLEALVITESSAQVGARRYEPAHDVAPDGDTPRQDDGDFEDSASWGPLQIMGSTARGLIGLPPTSRANWRRLLCNWPLGVGFGTWLLQRELLSGGGRVATALARYNGGPAGNPRPDGTLRNQAYVDRVRSSAARVHADRASGGPQTSEVPAFLGGGGR